MCGWRSCLGARGHADGRRAWKGDDEIIDLTGGQEEPSVSAEETSLHAALTNTMADLENVRLRVTYGLTVTQALQFITTPQHNGGWPCRVLTEHRQECLVCCNAKKLLQLRCGPAQGPRHAPYCVPCATQYVIKNAFMDGEYQGVTCPLCRDPWHPLGAAHNALTYEKPN